MPRPTIQLSEGFGAIPDRTDDVNARSAEWFLRADMSRPEAEWLSPNALGEYVACVVNARRHPCSDDGSPRNIVFGSLGFGTGERRAWVLGGPDVHTVRDFAKRWHAWLETPDGRVTDIVTPQWHDLAARQGAVIAGWDPDDHTVLIDRDPAELAHHGLHYRAADAETQGLIAQIAAKAFAAVLDRLV